MQPMNTEKMINDSNSVMKVSILSCLGDREEQQDSFSCFLDQDNGMVVICDGMGGHHGGAEASRVAVDCFFDDFKNRDSNVKVGDQLLQSATKSDKLISDLKDGNGAPLKAGSTCVSIVVNDGNLYWCSVGDSRAYLLRQDEFVQLTMDQNYSTVLKEKLEVGMISKEEFNKEKEKGEALISYLGIGNLSLIDFNKSPVKLLKSDVIVMMTDGYYRLLPDEVMQRVISNFHNGEEALHVLETKAKNVALSNKISRDNATMAIITIK